jgi:hypothetical protein
MATLTPISPAISGATVTPAAVSSSDSFANPRGNAFLYVRNGSGGSINVTLVAQSTLRPADGSFPAMTLSNNVVAVGAGAEKIIGPIPSAFNDGNGNVTVNFSATTSVTAVVIQQ